MYILTFSFIYFIYISNMIYIQKNKDTNLPHHFDCGSAMFGAIESGQKFKLISYEDLEKGSYDALIKNNLFVGSVEFMKKVFERIGLKDVKVPKNSNRESKMITIKDAKEKASKGEFLFIKPPDIKLFTGFVLDGAIHSCLNDIPDDYKVLSYQPFESRIESEWRVYIKNGEIYDSKNYSGDFKISPNYSYVKEVIKENVDFPCCYTIDIGILENGVNVVVEFNDMWAIGNYGMDNYEYLRLLKLRYFEIVKEK